MEFVQAWGHLAESFVLGAASIVASSGSSGAVSIGIVLILAAVMVLHAKKSYALSGAIDKARGIVSTSEDEAGFAQKFDEIDQKLRALGKGKGRTPLRAIAHGWREFEETLDVPSPEEVEDGQRVRNTVRPSFFFNSHDLGFEHGMWRAWPSIFFSIGLFATFLGIIAALKNLIGGAEVASFSDESMGAFLDAAKSKFIMSLTGLGSSIIFNIWYRWRHAIVQDRFSDLCEELEERMVFAMPEKIASEQLKSQREQEAILKAMSNDMGAQIGAAVSEVLVREIQPVLNKVDNSAGDSVSGMVGQLGDSITAKLNSSLDAMSETLSGINGTLHEVSGKLEQSGSGMAEKMSGAIEALHEAARKASEDLRVESDAARAQRGEDMAASRQAMEDMLAAIEANTRAGQESLLLAAQEISSAASSLKDSITSAGDEVGARAAETMQQIGSGASTQISDAGADITSRLSEASAAFLEKLAGFQDGLNGNLGEPIQIFAQRLESANVALERHASRIESAGRSHEDATERLAEASRDLKSSAAPIAASVDKIERVNDIIADALEANIELMEASNASVKATMSAMQASLEQLQGIIDDAEELDDKVKGAVSEIMGQLTNGQEQIGQFSDSVRDKFTEGLQGIQSVLDALDEFEPVRRRA